ncbi:protein RFT1 homolog isoform X2 [Athalia rosae]|nr:protein RFT1 homolog isoform X2 [Athalia rosae]
MFMSMVFGYTWLFILSPGETLPPYYTFAVWAVAISCVIELSSLIVQLVASAFLFVRLKVVLDTILIAIRTLTFISLIIRRPENALFAFGVAQLVAAVFYTTSHYTYFHFYITKLNKSKDKKKLPIKDGMDECLATEFPFKSITDFLPGQLDNSGSLLDKKLSILTWSFFRQGVLKQILTEGERLIMTFMPMLTFAEQGMYEIVNNLGSLAARFIFRPIEDSGYFYFTQMVQRDKPIADQNVVTVQESVNVLMQLCSVVTSIGLVVLVFGQSYSSLLLWLYGGSKLTADLPVLLLQSHCLAVLLLGINGVTECYTNATADSKTINRNNYIMIYESVAFLVVSYFFVSWFGPVGFIFGNCVNMALRILHSTRFIKRRHVGTKYAPLLGLVPKPIFVTFLIMSAIITKVSQAYFFPDGKLIHLIIGIFMFCIVIASWLYEHQDLIQLGINKWRNRHNKNKKSN